nr:phospholipase-like protein [Tanacetum cinerariifolium]
MEKLEVFIVDDVVDHDNHLLNHILQHQREVDFKSKEDTLKFDIGGHTLELGRIEFNLLTDFSIGKVIFQKVKAGDIPLLVRLLFPEKVPGKYKRPKGVSYNVKGLELLDFVKDDEKWKNISDVNAICVCLLLMAEHVFMGRETNHVLGKPIMMLAENLTAWDKFPRGEYFWTKFYGRTGSNPKVRLTATTNETNQEWWKRLHGYLDESLSAYENVKKSKNKRGEYADLDKGVSSGAEAGESSGEETVEKDKHSRRELELERLLRQALNVPHVNQELSYAVDDLHTMALDKDAKVCTDEPKPSTILHSFIQVDGVQFMALDEDAKVYFPQNEPNIHWSLAELHINSDVITFYDSLGPCKESEEHD